MMPPVYQTVFRKHLSETQYLTFDNEYDLAMTVIEGMEAHSQAGDYPVERFMFNCA